MIFETGHEVISAILAFVRREKIRAALEYLQSHHPDLMMTDVSMAEVTGWDLLFHEKLQRPNLPVFVITALPIATVGGTDRFAHEFFQKPLDLDALIAAIRRYIGSPGNTASVDD